MEKYEEFALRRFVDAHGDDGFACCPTAGCPFVFEWSPEDRKFTCPSCSKVYCLVCKARRWRRCLLSGWVCSAIIRRPGASPCFTRPCAPAPPSAQCEWHRGIRCENYEPPPTEEEADEAFQKCGAPPLDFQQLGSPHNRWPISKATSAPCSSRISPSLPAPAQAGQVEEDEAVPEVQTLGARPRLISSDSARRPPQLLRGTPGCSELNWLPVDLHAGGEDGRVQPHQLPLRPPLLLRVRGVHAKCGGAASSCGAHVSPPAPPVAARPCGCCCSWGVLACRRSSCLAARCCV